MVAQTPPTRFTLDPARADEFIDDLSAVENSLRHVAEKWNTNTGALSLFLASPEGLAIVAAAEIATAVHIRLQAQALLADVAQSMVYIVREYSREERRIPFNNDLRSIKLVELRRANARRAGNLLLRLAHYNPAPIRSYTVRPSNSSTPPCGTAVALDSRGLAHENHACAEPQACHTVETLQVSDFVDATSAQTCGMPKRPLGHGDANNDSACGTAVALDSRGLAHETHACAEPQACHTVETFQVSDFVHGPIAQTCGMPKRPLGHGDASVSFNASASLPATDSDAEPSLSVQCDHIAQCTPMSRSVSPVCLVPPHQSGP
jgi:hypothetical protein